MKTTKKEKFKKWVLVNFTKHLEAGRMRESDLASYTRGAHRVATRKNK